MEYIIEITDRDEIPSLIIQRTIAFDHLREEVASTLEEVYRYMASIGIEKTEPSFVAYHNQDMMHLIVEIGCIVKDKYPGFGSIKSGMIPKGKRISCLYKGEYRDMGDAYTHMFAWAKAHNLNIKKTYYELYLNSPLYVEKNELMTKIELLV